MLSRIKTLAIGLLQAVIYGEGPALLLTFMTTKGWVTDGKLAVAGDRLGTFGADIIGYLTEHTVALLHAAIEKWGLPHWIEDIAEELAAPYLQEQWQDWVAFMAKNWTDGEGGLTASPAQILAFAKDAWKGFAWVLQHGCP